MRNHDDINVQLLLTNFVVDLLEEHIDLSIRIGAISDRSLTALAAGSVRQIVCDGGRRVAPGRRC
jgi:DNA-binding transcriptional LysR family regulator